MKTIYNQFIEEYELFLYRVQNIHASIVERTQQHRDFIANLNQERFESLRAFNVGFDEKGNDLTTKQLQKAYESGANLKQTDIMKMFESSRDSAIRNAKKQPLFMNNERELDLIINQNREKIVDIDRREANENEDYAKFIREQEKNVLFSNISITRFRDELDLLKLRAKQFDNQVHEVVAISNDCDKENPEDVKRAKEAALKAATELQKVFGKGYANKIKKIKDRIAYMETMLATYENVSELYTALVNDGTDPKVNGKFDDLFISIENALKEIDEVKKQDAQATEFVIDINDKDDNYEIIIHAPSRGVKGSPYEISKKDFTREALNDYIMQTYLSMAFEDSKSLSGSIILNGRFCVASPVNELVDTFAIQELLKDNEKNIIATATETEDYSMFEELTENSENKKEEEEEVLEDLTEEETKEPPKQDEPKNEEPKQDVNALKEAKEAILKNMQNEINGLSEKYGEDLVEEAMKSSFDGELIGKLYNDDNISIDDFKSEVNFQMDVNLVPTLEALKQQRELSNENSQGGGSEDEPKPDAPKGEDEPKQETSTGDNEPKQDEPKGDEPKGEDEENVKKNDKESHGSLRTKDEILKELDDKLDVFIKKYGEEDTMKVLNELIDKKAMIDYINNDSFTVEDFEKYVNAKMDNIEKRLIELSEEKISNVHLDDKFNFDRTYYRVTDARLPRPGCVKDAIKTAACTLLGFVGGFRFGAPDRAAVGAAGAAAGFLIGGIGSKVVKDACRRVVNKHYVKKLQKLVNKVNKKLNSNVLSLNYVVEETEFNLNNEIKENTIYRPAIFYQDDEINADIIDSINQEVDINIQYEINKIFERRIKKFKSQETRDQLAKATEIKIKGQKLSLPYDMLHFGFATTGGIQLEDIEKWAKKSKRKNSELEEELEEVVEDDDLAPKNKKDKKGKKNEEPKNNVNLDEVIEIRKKIANREFISDEELEMINAFVYENQDSLETSEMDEIFNYIQDRANGVITQPNVQNGNGGNTEEAYYNDIYTRMDENPESVTKEEYEAFKAYVSTNEDLFFECKDVLEKYEKGISKK